MKTIIENYLTCLEVANLERMLKLFSPGATIQSPLYGKISAPQFYSDLFSTTSRSKIQLLDIFSHPTHSGRAAAHFRYTWTLSSGAVTELDCVDLFETSAADGKITQLTIIYDTHDARPKFERARTKTGASA